MPQPQRMPSVPAMNTTWPLRLGACAAVTGASAQLIATILEPDWGGDTDKAVRVVADSGLWNTDRLIDLIGVFLTVVALTVAQRALVGAGKVWAGVGQPLLVLMAALGASAIATGAAMKEMADTWVDAEAGAKGSYLATFHGLVGTTEVLFFGAFLALGLYLVALAAAITAEAVFPHWIGWAAALSAVLMLSGNLLSIRFDAAWLAVLAGFAVFVLTLVALGVSMWRRAGLAEPDVVRADVHR
jgi:hypothetical protein